MSQEIENVTATLLSTEPQPAAYHDLADACIGADAAFLCSQLEKRATLEQAIVAWMREQQTRLQASGAREAAIKADADAKLTAAKAEAASAKEAADAAAKKPGVRAIGSGSARQTASDSGESFSDAVAERMKNTNCGRKEAIAHVMRARPDLHHAYLDANNPSRKARELIADRFEK